MIFLFFLWGCNTLQSHQSFPNSSNEVPMLSPMVGCNHLYLYWSDSGRASLGTTIPGSHQQALHGISNSVGFGICRWDGFSGGAVNGWLFLPFQSLSSPLGPENLSIPWCLGLSSNYPQFPTSHCYIFLFIFLILLSYLLFLSTPDTAPSFSHIPFLSQMVPPSLYHL